MDKMRDKTIRCLMSALMGALKSYRPKSGTPKPQLFMHKMMSVCVKFARGRKCRVSQFNDSANYCVLYRYPLQYAETSSKIYFYICLCIITYFKMCCILAFHTVYFLDSWPHAKMLPQTFSYAIPCCQIFR